MKFGSDIVRSIRRYAKENLTESELQESRKLLRNSRRRHNSHELTDEQSKNKDSLVLKFLQEHRDSRPQSNWAAYRH